MNLAQIRTLIETPDLRRRLRRLSWFNGAFAANTELVANHFKMVVHTDERLLKRVFFNWATAIEPVEQDRSIARADRIVFMGGLALRELFRSRPVSVVQPPKADQAGSNVDQEIAAFWPEGFIYTNFCVCSIAAVHEQEFNRPLPLDIAAYDLRTWWSYRENVQEDPAIAIAYLDRFLGIEPNWMFPNSWRQRRPGDLIR